LPVAAGGKDIAQDPILDTTIDGRYAIEARLGEGGMGVVYKARHVLIDKPVAIKILRKEAAQDTASVQRFIQEAKSASKINHSNIVDITDFGVLADGHAYFVMEFLQGQTLAQAIQEGPIESARVCTIGAQVSRGLNAAHVKGIVHRDLKPENIFLLEREGQKDYVKIVDFGIAKVGGGQKLTQVGMVLGTPEYMSPEQATGQETDHRVDQYALGCIMYEMLTGTVPFLGERPAQTLTKHVFEPVIPPRKRKPELKISAAVESVVMRTLAKKPEQRFPSMRELELALTKVESEMKGGRVVIDDPSMAGPASNAAPQGSGANPAPSPPSYSGGMVVGGPNPAYGAPPPSPSYYPPMVSGPLPAGYPQGGVPGAPGAFASTAHAAAMSANRPTREGTQIKARRGRTIFAVVAGALVLVIGLLVYVINSTTQPPPPPPPKPVVTPHVDTPPKVESPPPKPPEPVVELSPVELQVVSSTPSAEVYVDGNLVGKTPYKFQSKRGVLVRVEVRKHGFDPYYEELEPDSDRTIDAKLDKAGHGGKKKVTDSKKGDASAKKPDTKTNAKPGKDDTQPGGGLPTGLRDPFHHGK
jgi:serine/threonine-protein kinase